MNQQIKTSAGVIVILIITATIGFFTWKIVAINNWNSQPEIKSITALSNKGQDSKQKEVQVSDWKTYTNKTYGYEMKYPADWKIGVKGLADPSSFSAPDFSSSECLESEGICPHLMVGNIHKAESGETIENKLNLNTSDKTISEKLITVSGEKASLVEYYQGNYGRKDGGMGLVRQEIKVMHNGTIYRMYVDEYNPDIRVIKTSMDWKNKAALEAMIASFKFLD